MKRDGEEKEVSISALQVDRKPEQNQTASAEPPTAELGQKEVQAQSTSAAAPPHCDGAKEELRRAEIEPTIVADSDHQVNNRYWKS